MAMQVDQLTGGQCVAMGGFALGAAAQILGPDVAVTGLVAKMRDVDQRRRIISQNRYSCARGQALNTFAQPQNRQRAQQPQRVNFQCLTHEANIGPAPHPVHVTKVPHALICAAKNAPQDNPTSKEVPPWPRSLNRRAS